MRKAETLERWKGLPENQDPLPHMAPIPYQQKGSKYGACGIRIDGTPEFVDAVMSNLKSLIAGENTVTRLELSRNPASTDFKPAVNAAGQNAEVCYIRLHMRGSEGSIISAIFDKEAVARTREYAEALGVE